MRSGEGQARNPGTVPDDAPDVRSGVDTDGDGRPDTLLVGDGTDLLVHTDLDGDGLVDRVLRIGPDGSVRETAVDEPPSVLPGWLGPDT